MRLILVDLDGTLLDRPSTEARFIRHLIQCGSIGTRQYLAAAGFFLTRGYRFGRHTARKNKAYLAAMARDHIVTLAQAFVQLEVLPRLRPYMLARLRHHRESGDRLVLLTGAPDFIADPVARHIGAPTVIATHCASEYGRFTARPPLQHPHGHAKLDLARSLCKDVGVALGDCLAYADAAHDISLMEGVGRAIAVTPDRGLSRAARFHKWEIITCDRVGVRGAKDRAPLSD